MNRSLPLLLHDNVSNGKKCLQYWSLHSDVHGYADAHGRLNVNPETVNFLVGFRNSVNSGQKFLVGKVERRPGDVERSAELARAEVHDPVGGTRDVIG